MKHSKEYQTFITKRLSDDVAGDEGVAKAVYAAAQRFYNCDWGDLCQEDKDANDQDLKDRDGHVLGKYNTPKGNIYINLVFDEPSIHSDAATIMYCDEY